MTEYNLVMPFYDHPRAAITADVVLFAGARSRRSVLLVRRGFDPHKGMWALPGGFVDEGERPQDAARRELAEETGVEWRGPLLPVGGYGDPGRDPRGWTVSIVWTASTPRELDAHGGDDAAEARWYPVDDLPVLAFDHEIILDDALRVIDRDADDAGFLGS